MARADLEMLQNSHSQPSGCLRWGPQVRMIESFSPPLLLPSIPVAPSSHDHISADSGSCRLHMHLQHLNFNILLAKTTEGCTFSLRPPQL